MFLSIFTDELGIDAYKSIKIIKTWGIRHVDFRAKINGKEIHEQTDEELQALKAFLDSEGMKTGALETSLCKVHMPDAQRRELELEKLEGLIRAANILDCKMIRAFNYWQHDDTDPAMGELAHDKQALQEVVEMFKPVLKRAKEAGLTLCFENCGQTPYEIEAFLNAIDVPEWGIAFDPANSFEHLEEAKGPATEYFYMSMLRTGILHVKVHSILPEFDEYRKLPWVKLLRAAKATGRDIPVSIETHNFENSPFDTIEASHRICTALQSIWPAEDDMPASIMDALAPSDEFKRNYADDPVRFVVVGMGMGRNRAQQLTETSGCKLYGVCDINPEKARSAGEALGVKYSTDIDVFLNDDAVEAVYIVTPTGTHCDLAVKCLAANKHVLTTKPMDAKSENCEPAIQLAKEKSLLFGVDFDVRVSPQYMEQRKAIANGWFGKVLSYSVNLQINRTQQYYDENGGWRGTWAQDGGGAMSNQGIHELDRLQLLLGIPSRVRARMAAQTHNIEADDIGMAELDYNNGCMARFSVTTSYAIPAWYLRIEINGEKGCYVFTSGGPEGEHEYWGRNGAWSQVSPFNADKVWRQASDNFACSIREHVPLTCPGEQGKVSRMILDAIYQSAKNDCWVSIDPSLK